MKANELRIGNKVQACLTREVVEIDWLALKHLEDGNIQVAGYDNSCVYKPIPLTEEWLLKFGFKYVKVANEYELEFGFIVIVVNGGVVYIELDATRESIPHISCVHQLQNLYFALTGEELKEI